MLVDGSRALIVGDYITPKTGEYAGRLGPWANLVEVIGIDPRSTLMKSVFVIFGTTWLAATAAFALGTRWSWALMVAFAVGSLWYLVAGTIASALMLAVLLLPVIRTA